MNLDKMTHELKAERTRIDAILALLEGKSPQVAQPSIEAPAPPVGRLVRHRRGMSAETRMKISNSMKLKWGNGYKVPRHLTPAAKNLISIAQKRRWAVLKASVNEAAPELTPA